MSEKESSKLDAVLTRKNISPSEFARMAGINSQTVNNWKRRGVPHSKVIEVAALLNVSVAELSQNSLEVPEDLAGQLVDYGSISTASELFAKYGDQLDQMSTKELMKIIGRIEAIVEKHLEAVDKENTTPPND